MKYKNLDILPADKIPEIKLKYKESNFKPKNKISIGNSYTTKLKRSSYLSILKMKAELGDKISKRILG